MQPAGIPNERKPLLALLVAGALVAAAVLRFGGIGAQSFWHDEVLTAESARVPLADVVESVQRRELSPPFYFLLTNVWAKAFGVSELSLRLPSAILGVASVFLLYRLGSELYGPDVGLTGAALLAVSPFHVAYSQEARGYALMLFLLLLATWAFARMLRSGSVGSQVTYVLAGALAMYTHTFAAFTLLALNLFYLQRLLRGAATGVGAGRWILLQLSIVALFWPWMTPTREAAAGLSGLMQSTPFLEAMAAYAGNAAAGIVMAACCLLALSRAWSERDDRILLLLLIGLLPVLAPLAYGAFVPRFGIPALVGLALLAAYGIADVGRWACIGLVVLAGANWSVSSTPGHPRYPGYTYKPDVRSAAGHVRQHAQDGDSLAVGPSTWLWPLLGHYLHGKDFRRVDDLLAVGAVGPRRIWLLLRPGEWDDRAVHGSAYSLASRNAFDGLLLLELVRVAPQSAPAPPPSSRPTPPEHLSPTGVPSSFVPGAVIP